MGSPRSASRRARPGRTRSCGVRAEAADADDVLERVRDLRRLPDQSERACSAMYLSCVLEKRCVTPRMAGAHVASSSRSNTTVSCAPRLVAYAALSRVAARTRQPGMADNRATTSFPTRPVLPVTRTTFSSDESDADAAKARTAGNAVRFAGNAPRGEARRWNARERDAIAIAIDGGNERGPGV